MIFLNLHINYSSEGWKSKVEDYDYSASKMDYKGKEMLAEKKELQVPFPTTAWPFLEDILVSY